MSKTTDCEQTRRVFEVEFSIQNPAYPFVGASESENCLFELAEMVPRTDDQYAEFFNVSGADPDRILELAAAHDTVDASLLAEYDRGGLFEFLVSGACPAVALAELGGLPREVRSAGGEGRIRAEIPSQYDPPTVVDTFLAEYPDAELASKREKDSFTPIFTHSAFEQVLRTQLTDKQHEVLRAAFEAGYYEWPRESTGQEVADELGITSATFSEHVQAAERKLLSLMFDGPTVDHGSSP